MRHFLKITGFSATSALLLLGCNNDATTTETLQEVSAPVIAAEPQQVVPSFDDISGLIEANDRPAALRLATELLEDMSPSQANTLIDTYFDRTSNKKNNNTAIVLAEAVSAVDPMNSKAAYIAGLAYWNEITVERNPARVVKYWDRPSFENNKTIQSRLAELYGDEASTVYDAEKAEISRQRATN